MASTSNLKDLGPVVDSLTLGWTKWYDETGELICYYDNDGKLVSIGDPHFVSYTPPSGGELQRNYDSVPPTTVGSYISNIEFSQEGNIITGGKIITVAITSSPRGNAETAEQRTYQFYLQPKKEISEQP